MTMRPRTSPELARTSGGSVALIGAVLTSLRGRLLVALNTRAHDKLLKLV